MARYSRVGERITNPYPCDSDVTEHPDIHARIPRSVYDDLFNKLLAGCRGVRQALVCQFIKALYEELTFQLTASGKKFEYDFDNEAFVQRILSNLNFNPANVTRPESRPSLTRCPHCSVDVALDEPVTEGPPTGRSPASGTGLPPA